jgi:spermidine/putrescine ABC transporter ATP-binding subunit
LKVFQVFTTVKLAEWVLSTIRSSEAGTVLEVQGVAKRYGSSFAVHPLDLKVSRGEFLTLLGPSGCGKTTLLRMIAGFEAASEGKIRIEGKDLTNAPPYRRGLGMVFQSLALFPHLTVADNIAFGLRVRRQSTSSIKREVDSALELVGLPHIADRAVHQLSGGQRQRVALARAIVTKPPILLLDEPLSALDLKLRRQMQIELKHLQRQLGTTFIFVTHDQEEAITMSDRIAVMRMGRIEQLATPDIIYRDPASVFVASFVGENNILDADIETGASKPMVHIPACGHRIAVEGVSGRGPVSIAIRPESIRLEKGAASTDALQGRVRERTFLGPNVRYVVEVGDASLCADAAASGQSGSFDIDDVVTLHIQPQRINVLPRQTN